MASSILTLILFVLALASIALAGYWGVVMMHVVRTIVRVPTARKGLTLAKAWPATRPWPSVCVVVPAHNEEACIQTLARSLIAQDYPSLRVVFALDRCTDATADAIRHATGHDERFELLDVTSCPEDWAGKVHAIWRGVQDSRQARGAEMLLFVDADTALDPSCVRACVALMQERELGMLSLLSTLGTTHWFERIAQPAAGMELIRQYPIERANAINDRRAFANGQFILIRRNVYDTIGGHEKVKDALLEDIQIAREVANHKVRAGMFLADGMHRCQMYATSAEFDRGWKRIYIESSNRRPDRLRQQALRIRVVSVALPTLGALSVALGGAMFAPGTFAPITFWCGLAGVVMFAASIVACYVTGRTPLWCSIFYPMGAWRVGGILRRAASDLDNRVPVRWGGKEYVLEPRSGG